MDLFWSPFLIFCRVAWNWMKSTSLTLYYIVFWLLRIAPVDKLSTLSPLSWGRGERKMQKVRHDLQYLVVTHSLSHLLYMCTWSQTTYVITLHTHSSTQTLPTNTQHSASRIHLLALQTHWKGIHLSSGSWTDTMIEVWLGATTEHVREMRKSMSNYIMSKYRTI